MTVVVLLPNETIVGSSHTQAIDANDATFVMVPRTYEHFWGLETVALPAGGRTRSVQINTRTSSFGAFAGAGGDFTADHPIPFLLALRDPASDPPGIPYASWSMTIAGATVTDRNTAQAAINLTQSQMDTMQFAFIHTKGPFNAGGGNFYEYYLKLHEASIILVYAAIPVVVVGPPSGTILNASPPLSWTYTGDSDADFSGLQQRYHIKVFAADQYGAVGFDPATASAAYDSGEVLSGAQSVVIGPLVNLTTFKAYVRAAQSVNGSPHWSLWDDGPTFTTNTDPPHVASIVANVTTDDVAEYLDPSAGVVYTPDTPELTVATDFSFTARLRMNDLHGSGTLVNQHGAWVLQVYEGHLVLQAAAQTYYPLAPADLYAAFDNDTDFYLGATFELDDGTGHSKMTAITSTDGETWAPVPGGPPVWAVPLPAITGFADSAEPLYVGSSWTGRVYSAEMRTGLGPGASRYLMPTVGAVTTPDPGPLPDEFVIVADVQGPEIAATAQTIAGQWTGPSALSFLFYVFRDAASSAVQFNYSTTGGAPPVGRFSAVPDLTAGRKRVAVAVKRSTGLVRFLRADEGAGWTVLNEATAAAITIFDTAGVLRIGESGPGALTFRNRIYSVEAHHGLDPDVGDVIWRFDGDDAPDEPGVAAWTDPRGRTWTATNPAAISGRTVWKFDALDYPGSGSSYVDPRGRTWNLTHPAAILAGGAVKINVTRDLGHTDWTHVDVERAAVDMSRWQPVRGALAVPAPNDLLTVYDYEQPEGVDLWYRARGIIKSGSGEVLSQGPWKIIAYPVVWTTAGCGEWLRAPGDPYGAVMIEVIVDEETTTTAHRIGLLDVIGRASPVSVWDMPALPTGVLSVMTRTAEAERALNRLVRMAPVLLYQGRPSWGHEHRWIVVRNHAVSRVSDTAPAWAEVRTWEIDYAEVSAPPVLS